jgi:hypothetical protein
MLNGHVEIDVAIASNYQDAVVVNGAIAPRWDCVARHGT